MKLVDLSLKDWISEIDSKSPAPGGGSVSAFMATMGVSLARMVGHLTVDKKKFLALDPKIQFEFKDVIQSLIHIKEELLTLVDKDTEAFNFIMKAYQLPKVTPDEIKIRKEKIQEATLEAIMVPLKVAVLSLSALHQFQIILNYGNPQTISDLGVATLSLSSGAEGGLMNVLINLEGIEDEVTKKQYHFQVIDLFNEVRKQRDNILEKVYLLLKLK